MKKVGNTSLLLTYMSVVVEYDMFNIIEKGWQHKSMLNVHASSSAFSVI